MKQCLNLAILGLNKTKSNPLVGCVITHKNSIISTGYHEKFGKSHAEVNAIQNLKKKFPNNYKELLKKAVLYVNLEPCSHYGKTPPCVNLIIKYKIPKIIIGTKDPFEKVNGRSILKLENHAKIIIGVLEKECLKINDQYFINHKFNRPFIVIKWAKSQDGFINNNTKGITKISCQKSIELSHKWRGEIDAIMVGTNTIKIDNPQLTTRYAVGKNPIRITIDRKNILNKNNWNIMSSDANTIILNEDKSKRIKNIHYLNYNKRIKHNISDKQKLKNMILILYQQNIKSILIEGGKTILQNIIDMDLWDEARIISSNKILKNGTKEPKIKIKDKEIHTQICGEDLVQFIYNRKLFNTE